MNKKRESLIRPHLKRDNEVSDFNLDLKLFPKKLNREEQFDFT